MFNVSQANRLLDAVIARLARGDGKGRLVDLGIQGTEAIDDGKVSKGVLYRDELRARGDGDPVRGLIGEVLDRLLDEQLKLRKAAIESYSTQAESIADGAGRDTIASALLRELQLYGAVPPDSDDLTRARERAYYLAIALCDVAISGNDNGISDPKPPVPDLRFRRHLLEIHDSRHRVSLIDVYREFLAVAEREPVHDVERVERVIGTFIEGVLVFRRIATCHQDVSPSAGSPDGDGLMLGDEELIDAVLRLFLAMSLPKGGDAPDPETILFRRKRPLPPRSAPETTLHLDTQGLHRDLLEQIEALGEGDELAHCSLHTSSAAPARSGERGGLCTAVTEFAARGGKLRNIERIGSAAELDMTIATLEEQIDRGQDILYRALLVDAPASHSPLLIGDRTGFLTREEDGLIVDAVAFGDEAGRGWCESHYEALWRDERAFTLATPNGLNHVGINGARLQLDGLERQRQNSSDA